MPGQESQGFCLVIENQGTISSRVDGHCHQKTALIGSVQGTGQLPQGRVYMQAVAQEMRKRQQV